LRTQLAAAAMQPVTRQSPCLSPFALAGARKYWVEHTRASPCKKHVRWGWEVGEGSARNRVSHAGHWMVCTLAARHGLPPQTQRGSGHGERG
jgi:hypothetical protein